MIYIIIILIINSSTQININFYKFNRKINSIQNYLKYLLHFGHNFNKNNKNNL